MGKNQNPNLSLPSLKTSGTSNRKNLRASPVLQVEGLIGRAPSLNTKRASPHLLLAKISLTSGKKLSRSRVPEIPSRGTRLILEAALIRSRVLEVLRMHLTLGFLRSQSRVLRTTTQMKTRLREHLTILGF